MEQTKTLRNIMSARPIVVASDRTLREVAGLFLENGIGGAPVVADERVVGVLSVGDLLAFAEREAPAEGRPDGRAPETVAPEGRTAGAGVREGEDRFCPCDVCPWPGSRKPPPDFFARYWADRPSAALGRLVASRRNGRVLASHTAAEAMQATVHALSPDTELSPAADYMLKHEIHRLLVAERGRLVGVVTTADMVRAMGGTPAGR